METVIKKRGKVEESAGRRQAGYVSCARSRASGVVATMMDASLGRQRVASVPHVASCVSCVVALFACHTLRLIVASCEGGRETEREKEFVAVFQSFERF